MAYATAAEIQTDFKNIDFSQSNASVVTATVTQFIAEADALINAYVGSRYAIPITAEGGLSLMKLLSRSLVVARIKALLEVKRATNTDGVQNVVTTFLTPTQVMKILADIRDDNLNVDGATQLVTNSGFYSQNVNDSVESVIKKDTKQW